MLKAVSGLPTAMGLDSMCASDLVAIQHLLRIEVNSSAYAILHLEATYRASCNKLEEVNRVLRAQLDPSLDEFEPDSSSVLINGAGPSGANSGDTPMDAVE